MNNILTPKFCWETTCPHPDPSLLQHPCDMLEQVQSMEAPSWVRICSTQALLGVSCRVCHQVVWGSCGLQSGPHIDPYCSGFDDTWAATVIGWVLRVKWHPAGL